MKTNIDSEVLAFDGKPGTDLASRVSSLALASIPQKTQGLLLRMFADPYLLEKEDRITLVEQLRECVQQYPQVSELRVLLGMALCVNIEPQAAIDELQESVRLAPNSFIAQLKLGELWMRLRVMEKAEHHTRLAALLSQSMPQAELARRQGATIRTMKQGGIERGGYKTPGQWIARQVRRLWARDRREIATAVDVT
ncbi:MAG: tetratricopeptide repeat protein [Terriglobales bacterium]